MKQRSPVVSTLLSLLVTLIGGGIYFYIAIPALNPKSFGFYLFVIVLCVLYMLAKFLFSSEDSQSGKKKKEPKQTILEPDGKGGFKVNGPHRRKWNKPGKGSVYRIPMVIVGLCLLVCVVGTVISAVPLCQGIARLGSLKAVEVEGATGELDTNYEGKTQAALDCLADGDDFVAIHVEAPDECTHNGDTPGKLQAIEWLSSRVVGPLVAGMDKAGYDYRILILSDHKTLTSTRGHDGDPVPYLIYDSRTDTHNDLPYTEEAGLKGPFMDNGVNLMAALFEQD